MVDRRFLLMPFLAVTLYGCASGATSGGGSVGINGAGTFTLAPGESRTILVATTYRNIRICNDVGSSGTIEAAIGDYPAVTLQPSVCNNNMGQYGDRITVHNISASPATGIYQSGGTKPLSRGGR
jgi:hypothetical protein